MRGRFFLQQQENGAGHAVIDRLGGLPVSVLGRSLIDLPRAIAADTTGIMEDIAALRATQRGHGPMLRRVVLHAGTSHTEATEFRKYMDRQREVHASLGVFYAPTPQGSLAHKTIFKALARNRPDKLARIIDQAVSAAPPNTHTIVFSYDGIYGSWNNLPMENREGLRNVAAQYPLEIWVNFREPFSYMVSLYEEAVRNLPHQPGGVARTLDHMLSDPAFLEAFEYSRFAASISAMTGLQSLRLGAYSPTVVSDMLNALGLPCENLDDPGQRLSGAAVAQLLHLSTMDISAAVYSEARRAILLTDDETSPEFSPSHYARDVARHYEEHQGHLMTVEGRTLADCWNAARIMPCPVPKSA